MKIRRRLCVAAAMAIAVSVVGLAVSNSAHAATGCKVTYTISSQWQGGFGANVNVTNLGDPLTSWKLTWSFTAGQTITQLWNGSFTQSGAAVTVTNASYNGSIGTGASTAFGFNGAWTGSNPVPTSFALNGVTCTGSAGGTPSATPTTGGPSPTPSVTPTPTPTPTGGTGTLPSSFRWNSSGILINPKSDASHNIIAAKDPSVVNFNGKWYVLLSTVNSAGNYGMAQVSFTDWSQAGSASWFYLDQTPIGAGYKTAPMVFYFAPQKLWYLTYQTGANMAYSTNPDISNPAGWSAPKNFYTSEPSIISQNIGSGFWVDSWVICDSANCYLFSADDNGHIYRSSTSLSSFPNFGNGANTAIAITGNRNQVFEADNVYQVGTNSYLLVVEAFGSTGRRVFNSWTASSLAGSWTPLATPFLASTNVTFPSGTAAWTQDFSSGELLRSNFDQTVTLSPCHLQYLYQGLDPGASGSYNLLPWRIGMATQTNSSC